MRRARILGIATAGMLAIAASPSLAFEPSGDWNDHAWSFNDTNEKQFLLNQAREIEFFEGGGFNHTTNFNTTDNSTTVCKAGEAGAFTGGCAAANNVTAIGSQVIEHDENHFNNEITGDNNTVNSDQHNQSDNESTNTGDVKADGTVVNGDGPVTSNTGQN